MLRFFLFLIILFSAVVNAKAKHVTDSTQNKIVERMVSAIAAKCKLADSTKKELSKYFYVYYLKIKKIRSDREKEISCFDDLSSLKNDFLEGLKKKFGKDVYEYYKKITEGCTNTIRKKNEPDRITER